LFFKFRIGYEQILHQLCFLVVDAFPQENVKGKYSQFLAPMMYNAGFFLAFIKPTINPIVQNLFMTGIKLIGMQFLDDI